MASLPQAETPPAAPAPLRAAIYARVSTPGQKEDGYSLDGQVTGCRALAASLGATVVLERQEVGSGADWDLPMLLDLLERAKTGEFDLLRCLATARLARDVAKAAVLRRQLDRAGVRMAYVQQAFDDSPTGRLMQTVFDGFDAFERENIALRFALGKREKVARGLVMGQGRVPFGFRRVVDPNRGKTTALEIEPEQADLVRRIVAELRDYSVDQVAERLTAEGIPTPTGRSQWAGASVYRMVGNPAIVGEYVHGKRSEIRQNGHRTTVRRAVDEWKAVSVPPIVSHADVAVVREAMERRRDTHGSRRSTTEDSFTLRGILKCGRCGGQLATGSQQMSKRLSGGDLRKYAAVRYYHCIRSKTAKAALANVPRCDISWLPAEPVEVHAWSLIRDTLLNPERLSEVLEKLAVESADDRRREERLEILGDEISRRRKALDKITRDRLLSDLDPETERSLQVTGAQIGREITVLTRERDALVALQPTGFAARGTEALLDFARRVSAGLDAVTPAEQRQIFRLLRLPGVLTPNQSGVQLGQHHYRGVWTGLIDVANHQSQSIRLKMANRPMPRASIRPRA